MKQPWEVLRTAVKITITPQPGREMTANVSVDYEYDEYMSIQHKHIEVNRDHVVVEFDYPDQFKKLVAVCDSPQEAWKLYQRLQEPVPVNWKDFL